LTQNIWNNTIDNGKHIGKKLAVTGTLGMMGLSTLVSMAPVAAHADTNHTGQAYHIVQGDTLSGIAASYGTTVEALMTENGLSGDLIYAGDTLSIPGETSAAPVQQAVETQQPVAAQTSAPASDGSIEGMIRSTFGANADYALHIAACESSMNPNAYNGILGAAGLFQIIPGTWASTSQAGQSPYNAAANIKAAYEIFQRDGYSWMEWECK
jgi:LysM repeat protein